MFEKEKILEFMKFFPVYMIFIGTLRLIIYYSAFNVSIINYIEFSEFLLSFFNSFTLLVIMVILLILLIGLWGNDIGLENNSVYQSYFNETFKIRFKRDLKSASFIVSIFLIFWVIVSIIFFKTSIYRAIYALYLPLLSFIFFIYREIRVANFKANNTDFPSTYINITIILIIATTTVIHDVLLDIDKVKFQHKYYNSKITLDDSIIVSDSIQTYIGKTNDFIYVFNSSSNSSRVIPVTRVKEIELKKK